MDSQELLVAEILAYGPARHHATADAEPPDAEVMQAAHILVVSHQDEKAAGEPEGMAESDADLSDSDTVVGTWDDAEGRVITPSEGGYGV
ncbi:uncharacterized protein L3040_003491 [Drepanopeziza brunnea f. sp. 'multigermtubi']|nr:hypothetical protein L3040_003491 [Drepanopeziza brunnea f. sp. 'multigermtubi']